MQEYHTDQHYLQDQAHQGPLHLLAWDYSSGIVSVALLALEEQGGVLHQQELFIQEKPLQRNESTLFFRGLMELKQEMQSLLAKGHPDALVIGVGPGSYNGLRVSMATAEAMSHVWEVPLLAIPSAWAMRPTKKEPTIIQPASQKRTSSYNAFWILGDARSRQYWLAAVQEGSWLEEPRLISYDASSLLEEILEQHHLLPRWVVATTEFSKELPHHHLGFQDATVSAVGLAQLGYRKWQQNPTQRASAHSLIYMKPPCITLPIQSS